MAGHSYENAYKLIHDVRIGVNEFDSGLWAGTNTAGTFSNAYIIEKINAAQSRMYSLMMRTEAKAVFYTTVDLTGVNSVYTLPWDFGRVLQFEDSDGNKIFPSSAKSTPIGSDVGNERLYYRSGNTFVLNKAGVTDTCTLKYFKQPRKLTWGKAVAGSGALSLTMEASDVTVLRNDYYNGFIIDNYTQALSTTISDFVASTRVATTAAITWATSDIYGTVSDLPPEMHYLIAPMATILIKSQHPAAQERPTKEEMAMWGEMFMETLNAFTTSPEDIPLESVFCDFAPGNTLGYGITIPGQGYTIFA
jgi:hypothetical protein